ncbi:glycoside hydrolase family 88/105 protein [Paracoccus saliphilus]|uniref:Glycoside hydrolase family 88 protein n=1 Tax=Paracoccus saliphilus TaxID=405559 RepID=A0AA45W1R5_9RHOB|nr:glycoside hydrolase family 88 protein [Paracoccus saliphilus]WCR01672.1 glycoside hydrolase family 88 protein [Paracoccus saliphilus]SIS61828.1 unsaturated rhamnogalacturonyl hydrolase [Paracoccus saliphilus]
MNMHFPARRAELEQAISQTVQGLRSLRHEGQFDEPNLDGTAGDYISFESWEWPQGVGLYGLAQLWLQTGDATARATLEDWYARQIERGLPRRNVNTTAPMLALSLLWRETRDPRWEHPLRDWADGVLADMPRTVSGGFQHDVSDKINEGELWDDTLFMLALFLASYGHAANRPDLVEEAGFQFLIHTHYLCEAETGLWFHGWTFDGNHNFARARWARGNSWISAGVLDLLELTELDPAVRRYLTWVVTAQLQALLDHQTDSGAWHTLVDDPSSYEEISATAAIGYALLKGHRLGLGNEHWKTGGTRALQAVLRHIGPDGVVGQVSYGTRMGEDLQFYRDIPIQPTGYGQSMTLLCLVEALNHVPA